MHACDYKHQTHELMWLDIQTLIRIFESLQLDLPYVGDFLY